MKFRGMYQSDGRTGKEALDSFKRRWDDDISHRIIQEYGGTAKISIDSVDQYVESVSTDYSVYTIGVIMDLSNVSVVEGTPEFRRLQGRALSKLRICR